MSQKENWGARGYATRIVLCFPRFHESFSILLILLDSPDGVLIPDVITKIIELAKVGN